jgi:hypothetical protein
MPELSFANVVRRGHGNVVGQMPVARLVHADRADAEAEEAGVISRELRLDRGEIREIAVHDFTQFCMRLPGRAAPDREHALDIRVEQAFAQHALPDHAGGAEQDDLHDLMKASRSALIVAASVVGMPCGKPL